jgi:hypothetical protein
MGFGSTHFPVVSGYQITVLLSQLVVVVEAVLPSMGCS